MKSEYLKKFYKKTRNEKIKALIKAGILSEEDADVLQEGLGLPDETADNMIENQLATFDLPYGAALNFLIDGKEYVIPMAIEEPSVIAAASAAGKIIGAAGGFTTSISQRLMIGQLALKNVPDKKQAEQLILEQKEIILQMANNAHPSIVKRGGGAKDLHVRLVEADSTIGSSDFLIVELHIATLEAMGANIVNTIMEGIAGYVEKLTNSTALMSILSNYATECLATASCRIPSHLLRKGNDTGADVRDKLIEAYQFAYVDPYRAVTNNKGIMNGVDAVVLATGNDWRAIEAGAHAFAVKNGQYRSLSTWEKADNGDLIGRLTLPLPVGTVGGSISLHPGAQFSKRLMGYTTAEELEAIIVSVGLAQNFAALKALVTEGIQKGHMGLHARSLALNVGAEGSEIEQLTSLLKKAPNINTHTAKELLTSIRQIRN